MTATDLLRRLADHAEAWGHSSPCDERMGEPTWADCSCGLDDMLTEARAYLAAPPATGLRPEPTCGTEPPFDPEGCGHDHHGALVCGEIVDAAWGPDGADPVYCEHIDRRYARWLERAALAAPPVDALDVERLARALRAIHGDVILLPDPKDPKEWAAIIADWYEAGEDGAQHPGPHLRTYYARLAGVEGA